MDLSLPTTPVSLVVAERGSPWESWVDRFSTGTPDVVVVLQEHGEGPDQLASRVRAQVASFEGRGATLARAVIVAGEADASTLAARALAVKTIVAPMVALGEGTLILDGNQADRFGMRALADTVSMQLAGSGVTVRATVDSFAHVA